MPRARGTARTCGHFFGPRARRAPADRWRGGTPDTLEHADALEVDVESPAVKTVI